jgi:hypothetical protein
MSSAYQLFEWAVVALVVALAGWQVWRTYAPKPRPAGGGSAPGCDTGCPSCNHCATTLVEPPKTEQKIEFHPRPR